MSFEEFLNHYGIKIKNRHFYDEALTHNSFANEKHLDYTYQRLEFLGDAVLQKYASLYFFQNYPKWPEGKLTKNRSNLVREESLAEVARSLNIGKYIRLGQGEINSRGFDKDSILADVFESLTGAIYLDQGEAKTLKWLQSTLFKIMDKAEFKNKTYDYKSELQELLQAENRHDLKYVLESQEVFPSENRTEYTISIQLDNQKFGIGKGFSKAQAEQAAAQDCLSKMKNITKKEAKISKSK
ncbi:ribonuclease-3 [Entomoplasma freundtii]|uniref:Ribonuclease 3 n=1 Tax=Entomoplasma freundtii TaxID=74700 RepID=A0A2K8NQZ0_9MOLU|nr:ribonuclease III [Entomoplasma freundtii]ATZ16252.1 ribonuclease III [Entomoplasma freundtii]TDY56847.1 ribonuclease-3 [Entomoplasma freundtii]